MSNAGRTASQNDRQISPTSALFTNWNPLSFIPIRNSGIFRLKFVIHSGMPPGTTPSVHSFTRIAIPEKPPVTIPDISKTLFMAVAIRAVPTMIIR